MTGREFFTRFPALYPFLLKQLEEAAASVERWAESDWTGGGTVFCILSSIVAGPEPSADVHAGFCDFYFIFIFTFTFIYSLLYTNIFPIKTI